jgi:gluconolactonase
MSSALAELVDPGALLTLLGDGFGFTEGPTWVAAERCLYFSDLRKDTMWRWGDRGFEVVRRPNFRGNGMTLAPSGELLVCEQLSSCVVARRADGATRLVAHHHRGRYLNSPNDVVVRRADASIYFTDPDYGRRSDRGGIVRSVELPHRGVYRVARDGGEAELVVAPDEFDEPNGLCFSPDERLLYVNDSPRAHVKVFDVAGDGSLRGGRVLRAGIGSGAPRTPIVDGMKCDERGNVWVTGPGSASPGGVWVLDPDGELVGVIDAPETVGNLAWGGEDGHTLFLATSSTLHAITTIAGPPSGLR